jgi:hypothetical protein
MNIKANTHRGYLLKYLLIGIAALVFGLWHLKDGLVTYPALREMADAYELLQGPLDENGQSEVPDGEFQSNWQALAAENEWPEDVPKLNDEIDNLLLYNYFIGGVFTAIGLACLFLGLSTIGKWVQLKDGVLSDKRGNSIDIKDIVEIDKKRWEKKGLATLTANSGGQTQKMILDDLKFVRSAVDQILLHIEQTVGEDKIINGETEAHYLAMREKKRAQKEAQQARLDQMDEEDA